MKKMVKVIFEDGYYRWFVDMSVRDGIAYPGAKQLKILTDLKKVHGKIYAIFMFYAE
jgi:hypothetical protein